MKILFVGENIFRSKGGIITVMKQILTNDYCHKNVRFIPVFASGDGFTTIEKIYGWTKAVVKYIFCISSVDIIHIHHSSNLNFYITSYLVKIAKLFKKKILLHNHAADFKEFYHSLSVAKKEKILKTFKMADAIIVLSKSWYHWYSSLCPNANWIFLPNAVHVKKIEDGAEKIPKKQLTLLYLGRIEQRKGIFDLLQVLTSIDNRLGDYRLIIAGNGQINYIKQLLHGKEVEAKIEILGYIDDKQKNKIFQETDIFILPSYNEGLPMSLLEAMAYGIVPIASKAGGMPDVIESGKNGILINAGNLNELRDAILKLAHDTKYRQLLSKRAQATVQINYNLDNYCKKLVSIYKDLYAKR